LKKILVILCLTTIKVFGQNENRNIEKPYFLRTEDKKELNEQDHPKKFAVYVNNPLSILIWKINPKVEYRFLPNQSILLSGTFYNQSLFHGVQSHLEYRKYIDKRNRLTRSLYSGNMLQFNHFYYGKAGYGFAFENSGQYGIIGGGMGQELILNKEGSLVLQFSEGIKICPVTRGDVEPSAGSGFGGSFYLFGPGAFIDLSINLGWRF
jgi:hypothetical protein